MPSPAHLHRSSGLPLRAEPENLVHPYLADAFKRILREVSTFPLSFDIINNVASEDRKSIYGGSDALNSTTDNNSIATEQAASPAARSASEEIDRWLDSLDGDALHFVVEFLSDDDEVAS